MKANATITLDFPEGLMSYSGVDEHGNSKWAFFERQEDGTFKGNRPPKRLRKLIRRGPPKSKKEKR